MLLFKLRIASSYNSLNMNLAVIFFKMSIGQRSHCSSSIGYFSEFLIADAINKTLKVSPTLVSP